MAYEKLAGSPLDYYPCSYGSSRLTFRGPKQDFGGKYLAFLGGTETYGKFIARPFPDLLEDMTGRRCLNLGVTSAGIDSFVNDAATLEIASQAEVAVVQILGVQNLSNRYYSVHPRRNDRFLNASAALVELYQDVDFTEFHFTNHMLGMLAGSDHARFETVLAELQEAWVARMKSLLDRIASPTVLFWMADHGPDEKSDLEHAASSPFGVTQNMLSDVSDHAASTVIVKASAASLARGNEGMIYASHERQATLHLLGPMVHIEASVALLPVLEQLMNEP